MFSNTARTAVYARARAKTVVSHWVHAYHALGYNTYHENSPASLELMAERGIHVAPEYSWAVRPKYVPCAVHNHPAAIPPMLFFCFV